MGVDLGIIRFGIRIMDNYIYRGRLKKILHVLVGVI